MTHVCPQNPAIHQPVHTRGGSPTRRAHWVASIALSLSMGLTASLAQAQHAGHDHAATPSASASNLPWVSAEVRKVDAANGKVTLKHADVPNLDMPGMTMSFAVADRQWLQGLKPGDAVNVTLDKVQGQYTVMSLKRQ